jgi:hypothetical protein
MRFIRIKQYKLSASHDRFSATMREALCSMAIYANRKVRVRMTRKSKINILAFDELQTSTAGDSVHPYQLSGHRLFPPVCWLSPQTLDVEGHGKLHSLNKPLAADFVPTATAPDSCNFVQYAALSPAPIFWRGNAG